MRNSGDVRNVAGVACLLVVGISGCGARFRVPFPRAATQPATAAASEVWTLPGPRSGAWLYERTDLMQEQTVRPERYPRQTRPGRIVEGRLIGVPFLPLTGYLRRPEMTPAQMNALPKAPVQRAYAALIIELDSPTPLYPLQIHVDEPVIGTSKIGCFDRNGHRVTYGTIDREVRAEGREDVTCRAGSFPNCKRLRIDLRFRFPWGVSVDATEYLWLADTLGEVKRVEHITGWIWLFWMESAYEYSLVSFQPATTPVPTRPAASRRAAEPIDWSCIAVVFDRVFPHPRVNGMYVELIDAEPDPLFSE